MTHTTHHPAAEGGQPGTLGKAEMADYRGISRGNFISDQHDHWKYMAGTFPFHDCLGTAATISC